MSAVSRDGIVRSLGTIVYPDGSQAEIVYRETGAPIWESWTEIVRLSRPRKLRIVQDQPL